MIAAALPLPATKTVVTADKINRRIIVELCAPEDYRELREHSGPTERLSILRNVEAALDQIEGKTISVAGVECIKVIDQPVAEKPEKAPATFPADDFERQLRDRIYEPKR